MRYIAISNQRLIQCPDFENGIVKIQSGQERSLTATERSAVEIFILPAAAARLEPAEDADLSFAESLLRDGRNVKRRRLATSKYRSTEHVSATSNVCERLFSRARLIMNHLRSHMDPDSCEMLLFLKVNSELWSSPRLIDEIIAERRKAGVLEEGDDEDDEVLV